jgi:hypothetical protein
MLVAGNGESRRGLDLPFNTIGCNAVFRDHSLSDFVCIDPTILDECLKSPNTAQSMIHTKKEWIRFFKDSRLAPLPEVQNQDPKAHSRFWSSGCYALLIAATVSKKIDVVGFDLYSGNIYKDTQGYSPSTLDPPNPQAWIYQISTIIKDNEDKYFTFYNRSDWIIPESWKLANVFFESLDVFNGRR